MFLFSLLFLYGSVQVFRIAYLQSCMTADSSKVDDRARAENRDALKYKNRVQQQLANIIF